MAEFYFFLFPSDRFLCSHLSQIWIFNTFSYDDLYDIHGIKGTVEFTSPGKKFYFIVLG